MDKELIGLISGILIVVSVIPYAIRTYQKKVHPNITSWSLWTFIGLALLLTYKSSGAKANVWAAVFGFTNPLIVTLIAFKRQYERTKLNKLDIVCLIFGIISLVMWLFMRESKDLVQYALYVAIVADSFACLPTIAFLWKSPDQDRPFAWGFFSVAYSLNFFAISDFTLANLILPIYMTVGSFCITVPLCVYRFRKKSPVMDWI
ncbi:MAG: hypothetical protein WC648_01685 [Candidatus Paceibacterota bacterium]